MTRSRYEVRFTHDPDVPVQTPEAREAVRVALLAAIKEDVRVELVIEDVRAELAFLYAQRGGPPRG